MDLILVIIGIVFVVFTSTMIVVFVNKGSVPDVLITCVFAALFGECSVMGWIKNVKEKQARQKELCFITQ